MKTKFCKIKCASKNENAEFAIPEVAWKHVCRVRNIVQNERLVAKFRFDTTKNELSQVEMLTKRGRFSWAADEPRRVPTQVPGPWSPRREEGRRRGPQPHGDVAIPPWRLRVFPSAFAFVYSNSKLERISSNFYLFLIVL